MHHGARGQKFFDLNPCPLLARVLCHSKVKTKIQTIVCNIYLLFHSYNHLKGLYVYKARMCISYTYGSNKILCNSCIHFEMYVCKPFKMNTVIVTNSSRGGGVRQLPYQYWIHVSTTICHYLVRVFERFPRACHTNDLNFPPPLD